jgi:hypothetical protein
MQIDLRAQDVDFIIQTGIVGSFYQDLTELFDSLSGITFAFNVYDGPDPDSDTAVTVDTSTDTDGMNVTCSIAASQPNMVFNRKYFFAFNAIDSGDTGNPIGLCRGTIVRRGTN